MKKQFGQNLLCDKNYLNKIIKNVDLLQDDTVLEIGAGSGLLTCELAKVAKKIIAIEPERVILNKLKENLRQNNIKNVEVIESDFLKLDLTKLMKSKFKVIGNIPYNITSPILIKLFGEIDKPAEHLKLLDKVFLMLQLEVAQRIIASPGTKAYSPLTILIQYFASPNILFKVPRTVFVPRPKVDSAFVSFNVKQELQIVENPALLKNVIRISFQQRRKKIINSLNKLIEDKDQIKNVFNSINLDHNLRAEDLDLNQFLEISKAVIRLQ